jgi:3-oxoadipate enol-lactonase
LFKQSVYGEKLNELIRKGLFMKKIKVGPNDIAFKEMGEGEAIVFLHGFCGSLTYWDKVAPVLSSDYHVILIDLRGHGNSSASENPFTIDDMAKDIKEVLESLQIGQFYLFGHSLGGYITLSLVEHYPEKLKGYGLIHSTAFPDSEEAREGRVNSAKSIEKDGIQPFIDGLIPKLFSDDSLLNLKEEVESTRKVGYSTNSKAAKQTLLAMKARPDRNIVLENKNIPVLLVAGDQDKIIPVDKAFSVEGNHVLTKIIAESGHMSMLEKPNSLIEAIREFLQIEKI